MYENKKQKQQTVCAGIKTQKQHAVCAGIKATKKTIDSLSKDKETTQQNKRFVQG